MVRRVEVIHIYSSLNTWIDMLILFEVQSDEDSGKVKKVIQGAYERWFTSEGNIIEPIGDYISSELDAVKIKHTIYYKA